MSDWCIKLLLLTPHSVMLNVAISISEPGIRCGNEDSRGNENGNRGKKYFLWRKKRESYFFSIKIKMIDLCIQI